MADIFLDRDVLHLAFGPLEKLGALRSDHRFPVTRIRAASVSEDPFAAIRGIRSPGTGLPGMLALGTWRSRAAGRSLVAAYRGRPALVLELDDDRFDRIVVSTPNAAQLAAALATPRS